MYLLQGSHEVVRGLLSSDDEGEASTPGGRSLSMPLSVDMKEKRVMSDGRRSLKDSSNSKSSCSWLRENDSDVELDRNHLDRIRPVGSVNSDSVKRPCRRESDPTTEARGEPLTDVKTLRPHVEAHLWIGKGAVAQRPAGRGFCCVHTGVEEEGSTEETKSITAPFQTRQNILSVRTAGLFTLRSHSGRAESLSLE